MDFGRALDLLRTGQRVARINWGARGEFITLIDGLDIYPHFNKGTPVMPTESVPIVVGPTVVLYRYTGEYILYAFPQADILATDWVRVAPDKPEI